VGRKTKRGAGQRDGKGKYGFPIKTKFLWGKKPLWEGGLGKKTKLKKGEREIGL
jgi:hypothetical protein